MSGLPSFFQQKGKTVLDELADYELGGALDEEDDDGIIDDSAFTDGYGDSEVELPSFFQSATRISDQPITEVLSANDENFPSRPDDVNLSNLLDNFTWPGKGEKRRMLLQCLQYVCITLHLMSFKYPAIKF